MNSPNENPKPEMTLRERAEAMLTPSAAEISRMPAEDVQKLVYELQVHQMELAIQNEDLRDSQLELAHSRDRYSDLYEFAPVGYLTLDRHGVIQESNLTATALLGVDRKRLVHRKLSDFIAGDSQEHWHVHRREVFADETKKSCEVALNVVAENPATVRLESLAFRDESGNLSQCRTALIDITNVQDARRQLEESEQRYRRLTDAVTDYVYRVQVEHGHATNTIHGANCQAVTGYDPEEFLENPLLWIAMVPPEDRVIVEQQVACVLADRDALPIEHRIQRKDGNIRWVLNTVSPQHDQHGRLIAYDGLLRDITPRKEAEAALCQLNETLEQRVAEQTREVKLMAEAMANLGEGVMITTDRLNWPGPQIVYVNAALCRITGYTAQELIGQTPRLLQGKRTDQQAIERLRNDLSEKRSHLCELVNYRKDGTTYDAELFITPLFDADGNHTDFIAVHRDITARRRVEESLRESEERMRAILNTAADAIITIDQRGIIDGVNAATESMFGYARAELIGQNVKILMPSPFCDEHDSYIARYLETGQPRVIGIGREVIGRRKDGSTFPIGLSVSEVGHLGLFTGIVQDISDRRNLQKQVLEIAAEEDRRIGHELHDNVQQQLTGLGLLAQSQTEALTQESSPQADMAARLAHGIREAANFVHLLSRGLVPVEVDAQGLRSALTDLAATVSEQYSVRCNFQCVGSVTMLDNFSATHLYRIAQEAINNAIKHGKAECIEMSLAGDNEDIILKVLDNGIGIGDQRENESGMGLRIMDYRAGLIGATVQVVPRKDGGTLVICKTLQRGASLR